MQQLIFREQIGINERNEEIFYKTHNKSYHVSDAIGTDAMSVNTIPKNKADQYAQV